MNETTDVRKLLVLRGPGLPSEDLLELLRERFSCEEADELVDALGALRNHRFHAVLAAAEDYLPLERGMAMQQASVVLDTIADGVCLVGPGGEMVWANRRVRDLTAEVLQALCEGCRQAYEDFATAGASHDRQGRRFSIRPDEETYYEVICSPVRDPRGLLQQVAAVVVNASHQRRQQQKLNAIDRAGRELVRLDYESLRDRDASQRLSLLEDRIIRCSREVLNYQHFAVLLLDERSNRLEEVVSAGLDRDAPFQLFANTEGNGICGYVAATGRSYISSDVRSDPLYRPGLRSARSSLTVPLRLHDKVIGVLNVESDRAGAFCEEDRQFAEIFGNYVALALHILNLLVFERHSTHCRVSDSISSELAGPVNDIITEASAMVEDYIGDDALRSRLGGLIEQATQTRDAIQRLAEGGPTGTISRGDDGEDGDPAFAGKRVLVADDEEMIRHTIQDVLSGQGCEVEAVCDGAAAIRRLESGGYDLVISDIKMPQANGYEVFAAAKKHNPAAAVILVTGFGYDPGHSIVRANREGLSAVLFKPFKVKQLVEECRSALAGREA